VNNRHERKGHTEPLVPKLYRVPFPVPDWQTDNILRWNYSNALTLWHAGHSAVREFIKDRDAAEDAADEAPAAAAEAEAEAKAEAAAKAKDKAEAAAKAARDPEAALCEADPGEAEPSEAEPPPAVTRFENKYRYYLSAQENPRVNDIVEVFRDIFSHAIGDKDLKK